MIRRMILHLLSVTALRELGENRMASDAGLFICSQRSVVFAGVVKLVDTGDLKSPGHCDHTGSIPVPGKSYVKLVPASEMKSETDLSLFSEALGQSGRLRGGFPCLVFFNS